VHTGATWRMPLNCPCAAAIRPAVQLLLPLVFIARYHASAVYAIVVCLSVCPSVTRSQVLLKRLNVGSRKQRHTIAQDSSFLLPKISAKFKRGHPNGGAKCSWGRLKSATFDKLLAITRKRRTSQAYQLSSVASLSH